MDRQDFSGYRVTHYLLMSLLASGSGGSVYQAVDLTLHDSPTYAIKCVPVSEHLGRRRQQLAEIVNHDKVLLCPNVLTISDVFEEHIDKNLYIFLVLPLCEMDMFKVIFCEKLYWRNDALIKKVFVDILDGVLACHKKGVYHRDLKPENIMCSSEGTRIKLADFGLSTNRRLCRDGGCGTAAYMSPECLDEEELFYYADQADVWSLGVILFNMITCRFPWEEARERDMEYKEFRRKKGHLLRTSGISESVEVLFRRIWDENPMRRMSIAAIRQVILDMDTFYKPRRLCRVPSPLSLKEVADSERTCVASTEDDKKNETSIIDALEEAFRVGETTWTNHRAHAGVAL